MTFTEALEQILAQFDDARTKPIKDHPLATFMRHELPDIIRPWTDALGEMYLVTGSPGRYQNWAEVPWLAVYDQLVTDSAERGYYLVYLFAADRDAIYLSLNQGITQVTNEHGAKAAEAVLRSTAATYRALLPSPTGLINEPLQLGAKGERGRGYEAGNILAIKYEAAALPDDATFRVDLERMLGLYSTLTEARAALDFDADAIDVDEEGGSAEGGNGAPSGNGSGSNGHGGGFESGRKVWHKVSESNRKLKEQAKKLQGYTCRVCGFNFEERYGALGREFIHAHHLTPLSELAGRPTHLDPATDFAVVCANCHSMIHRRMPYLTIDQVRVLLLPPESP